MRVSTDVGGTFTDYVILDNGKIKAFKALTTPDPSTGIIEQLNQYKKGKITEFSHGTTVVVNSVLERKGTPLVFFTTKGFKDLVHIGRQARNNVYSFLCEKPKVPVDSIVEISERTSANGEVETEVSCEQLKIAGEKFSNKASVAVVGFINSYINPRNEIRAEEVLNSYFPVIISSHKNRREIREYDRFCTSIIEGYCTPLVDDYLEKLNQISKQFYIMQSNGGRTEISNLKKVNMLFSGPAGGVAATQALCAVLGIENAIAYDMGGTSADISAIVSGSPLFTDNIKISGIPIKILAIDIESIGAGGGSIAWVDDGGALKVGPESSGSNPGPACYNHGGSEFTVSDANLVMGILGDRISEINLDKNQAINASKKLCTSLDMNVTTLSKGIIKIVNNNMVAALKNISVGKGYDPRNFAIVAFGGAGPMHACALAEAVGIRKIIVPPQAGAFSALGIMSAPIRFDYIRTILIPLENANEIISNVTDEFMNDLNSRLGKEFENVITKVSLDIRYHGQGHEINIPISENLTKAFNNQHQNMFGFNIPDNPIEVVNVKLVAEQLAPKLQLSEYPTRSSHVKARREVYPYGMVNVYDKIFHRSSVNGPCIIEDLTTTIYVDENWEAELDNNDILHLERV